VTDTTPNQPLLERPARPTFHDPSKPDVRVTVTELFGPNFRDGVVEIDYLLCTRGMKQMYRRDFIYLSRLLYALDRYRTISLVDQTKLDAVEQLVVRKLDNVRKLIAKHLKQAAALIEANEQKAHAISYPRSMRYRAPIISPYAREYMEVLSQADAVYAKLEISFLLGLIDRHTRSVTELEMRQAIRTINKTVRQMRVEMAKYVSSLRAGADQETRKEIEDITHAEALSLQSEAKADSDVLGSVSTESDLNKLADQAIAAAAPGSDAAVATA
jgi:hypothetical protein